MKIQILDKAKKKKIIEEIEHFGVRKIPELLIRTGKERIRAYSGDLSKEEIMDIWKVLPIEGVGLYIGKEMIDRNGKREVRLSIDALHIWKDQIKNSIIELDEEKEEEWFKGKDLEIENIGEEMGKSFVAIKSKDSGDFIGTGKVSEDSKIIYNYLPKERRRKSQVI